MGDLVLPPVLLEEDPYHRTHLSQLPLAQMTREGDRRHPSTIRWQQSLLQARPVYLGSVGRLGKIANQVLNTPTSKSRVRVMNILKHVILGYSFYSFNILTIAHL